MKFYVYCLSNEPDALPSKWPEGLGGALARALEVGGSASFVAVVSEFEGGRAPVTRESLRAHNRVNAQALARSTPLPFRFGTLADEARLRSYVAANDAALRETFARVRGCVEMGVKIRIDENAEVGVEKSGVKVEEAGASRETGAGVVGRGTAFLLAKRREILGDEALRARAEGAASRLAACVEAFARESVVRLSPEGPIVLRASHLVGRADVSEYRARARSFGASLEGLHVLASGPWPPYSFGLPGGPAE